MQSETVTICWGAWVDLWSRRIVAAGGGNHRHKVDVSLGAVAVSLIVVILLLQPECKWYAAFDGDD